MLNPHMSTEHIGVGVLGGIDHDGNVDDSLRELIDIPYDNIRLHKTGTLTVSAKPRHVAVFAAERSVSIFASPFGEMGMQTGSSERTFFRTRTNDSESEFVYTGMLINNPVLLTSEARYWIEGLTPEAIRAFCLDGLVAAVKSRG